MSLLRNPNWKIWKYA